MVGKRVEKRKGQRERVSGEEGRVREGKSEWRKREWRGRVGIERGK